MQAASLDEGIFKLMVDRVRDYAIFVLDRDGRIASWNVGAARIKQYAADEVLGKHFSIFYTPEDVARKWPEHELAAALREGRFEDEGWRVKKDGTRFWANVIITALRDDAGQLLGFSKITRDLSQRRREDEALRQSEERFRLLVDGVQDYAIYMLSPDGAVTSWNLGARRIKGYEASEILGKHFSTFYPAADVEAGKPWAELAMAREHGRAEDEGWRVRKNGTRFWARVVVTAMRDASGTLRGFAKVTQDLTQRRHAEALEDSARRINDFIAVLAHELRNPLAPIRNAVAVLERAKPGQKEFDAMRHTIDRQSTQLARIVDDLLDITRITRGTLVLQRAPLEVADLVARAVEGARPAIDAARHTLVLQMPHGAYLVEGDVVRLAQALTNILNNAARYTDPGGRITLSVRRDAESGPAPVLEIRVRDTGQGIETQLLGSIFGMFVQGRANVSRPQTGLGVGLALARSIVELHQGTVQAYSEGPGKGSELVVRLPEMSAAAAELTAQRAAPAAQARQPSRRVLVVDDNADAAAMLSELLRALGHEVVTVNGGNEALVEAENFKPDIILLDIGMPGMSGFEVARRLRARRRVPEPLIVAVTGWGKQDDEARSRDAGFDLHLVKPLEPEQLHKLFERAATRH